jgi:hypothetical protein
LRLRLFKSSPLTEKEVKAAKEEEAYAGIT